MKQKVVRTIQAFFKISFLEKLLVTLIKTFPNATFLKKMTPQNYCYSENDFRICNRYGVDYKLYIRDYQQWLLYFYNENDSSFDILNFVNRGDSIIDVGGNIGQTAMMIANRIGESGNIISFEPFKKTYDLFKYNLSINTQINNILIENMGLGERQDEFEMIEECSTNSGGNRIASSNIKDGELTKVEINTLDSYFEKNKISTVDLIKIDVEGFEMKILNGSLQTLTKFKPKLFIEIEDNNLKQQGDSAEKMINFLLQYEYKIYGVPNLYSILKPADLLLETKDIFCE